MSTRKQNKIIKRRSYDQMENLNDRKRHISLTLCDVESRSSSCGSKKSHKKMSKTEKDRSDREDNFYIVDKIVGHKICHGKSFFKVQWQGYDESEDSWEPEENLSNVLDLIEDFKNSKISDNKSEDSNKPTNVNRSRNAGCYEYVPSNKVVATKTKYFDDIRDGKIDLTKNDLYSRVKTRKRLHLDENVETLIEDAQNLSENLVLQNTTEVVETVIKPEDPPNSYEKSKFYQTNLFEMTAEFIKSGNFKKSQNTIASKSSSNDDISLFNYSISPNTNQSDDFVVQISPAHQNNVIECNKNSVSTQTIDIECNEVQELKSDPGPEESECCYPISHIKPNIQQIIDKIDKSFERPSIPQKLVTDETHLLNIYARELRQGKTSGLALPTIQTESDLVSIDNFDDLRCSILMDRYHLLHIALQNGANFNWNETFMPECLTPLQLAVTKNRVNIVRLLLRYGAAPDHCDPADSDSPLVIASSLGHVHVVKALLDHGVFTDHRSKGRTALYFAIENGRVDVVSMLLKFGTNFYRIADNLSGCSFINDMFMTNSLSSALCVDLLTLVRSYHVSFVTTLNRAVTRYLTKHLIKQTCIIFPHQWVSVLEHEFHLDFLLDSSIMTSIDTPILFLVHGLQADCDFEFWLDNNCCCVESVFVNNERQSSLSSNGACFVTTLSPLQPSTNSLTVNFIDRQSLSPEERQIRVAIVALSIEFTRSSTVSNHHSNSTRSFLSPIGSGTHSRHYH